MTGVGRKVPERGVDGSGGELVGGGVAVAPKHDDLALALVVVPDAFLVCPAAVRMPNPVALDDLIVRALGDGSLLDGLASVGVAGGS